MDPAETQSSTARYDGVVARISSTSTAAPSSSPGAPRSPIKIIAVDDDDCFREMLANELDAHGFAVETFPNAHSLLDSIAVAAAADVIVLDWMMPRFSGIDLLSQLRRLGINLPVVFLTGRALTSNETRAFDNGAVDFVDKARGMEILVRRLRRVAEAKFLDLKREKFLECGRLMLKPPISRAFWNSIDLDLTVGEFKIVQLLAEHAGEHVTYRQIYDCMHYKGFIGGYGTTGYQTNVRSAIKRVRNKFRRIDPDFDEIENYAAFGYVWKRGSADLRNPTCPMASSTDRNAPTQRQSEDD